MLQLSNSLMNRPILSLRTGGVVGTAIRPIINPMNLKIEGFYCIDGFERKKQVVLLYQDIRDLIAQGIVINDHDVLTDPAELVRLKNILELNFELLGKPVVTVSKEKIGRVVDYSSDSTTMFVQKIYVGQSIFKSLSGGNLGIDRTQIVEVSDKRITVQDLTQGVPAAAKAWA